MKWLEFFPKTAVDGPRMIPIGFNWQNHGIRRNGKFQREWEHPKELEPKADSREEIPTLPKEMLPWGSSPCLGGWEYSRIFPLGIPAVLCCLRRAEPVLSHRKAEPGSIRRSGNRGSISRECRGGKRLGRSRLTLRIPDIPKESWGGILG